MGRFLSASHRGEKGGSDDSWTKPLTKGENVHPGKEASTPGENVGRSVMLYALCGRSRVGKTTIQNRLLQRQPLLERLVTTTTRPRRPEEINHVDYHFVTEHHFHSEVQSGQIVCPICYRGQWYGTARADLATCARKEVVGVLRPDKLLALQAYTPLLGIALIRPVEANQTISPDDLIIVAHHHRCRYHVVNVSGELEQTVEQVLGIIHAHTGDQLWKQTRLPA